MAFTAADVTALERALVSLATGKRKVSLTMGDKSITYGQSDIPQIQNLLMQAKKDVQAASTRPSFVLTSTSKGL
jgi:hypothetical protein